MTIKTCALKPALLAAAISATLLGPASAWSGDVDLGIKIDLSNKTRAHEEHDTHRHSGPPDHAPAHGYRAKHKYHYYPDSDVYFDSGRRMYFYLSDNRWTMSASIPLNLKARLGEHVTIEMDSDKPYREHDSHRHKYHSKHKEKHKNHHKEKHKHGDSG
ncbi:MAG: hypothetical protein AB1810_06005 [Pseudomonadota bacterium]